METDIQYQNNSNDIFLGLKIRNSKRINREFCRGKNELSFSASDWTIVNNLSEPLTCSKCQLQCQPYLYAK